MVAINQIHDSIRESSRSQSSCLDGLTEEQQQRLTEQLDRYLVGLEQGEPIDASVIVSQHPDIAEPFRAYLGKLEAIYGVATGFGEPSSFMESPKKLGDFQIRRVIGRGGMGVVYEAWQQSLGRRVAIKLLPLASMLDPNQLARFQNEAHAAGLLQHPNIVPVYSVGSDRGIHYYAMQFIAGQSMERWIASHREWSRDDDSGKPSSSPAVSRDWRRVVEWGIDVADALQTAHESGVIHRDVKPSNLMLDETGKIWITDFGLARCQSEGSITKSGDMLGTVRYMSPEQAGGKSALVDGRCDIYSLATTLYEMLSLYPAFDGESVPEILKQIESDQRASLRKLAVSVPRDLETVIAKAMSKNRDDRYETAAEFAEDLRRVVADQPTVARPPTIFDHTFRFASRHRTIVMLTTLFLMIGSLGLAIATVTFAALKENAEASATRATRNEILARGAVDRLGSQMAELLAEIPAADPVRRRLLMETLDYYQQFAAMANHDEQLQGELALTLGKIGSLQAELNETQASIESLRQSEQLFESLATSDAAKGSFRLDWSTSQNNLAQALVQSGRFEDAARYYSRAIKTQRQLLAAEPSRTVSLRLAATLNNLGLLLAQVGSTDEAESRFVEAMEILNPETWQSLPELDKSSESRLESNPAETLASVLCNLSDLVAKHSPVDAVSYARRALAAQTAALEKDRNNVRLASQVVITLNRLGAAQSQASDLNGAKNTLHRAIEIGEQLLGRVPDHAGYMTSLVVSWNHLGLTLAKEGDFDQSTDALGRALHLGRKLQASFPNHAETQSTLAGVLNNLGFLQQKHGDFAAAASSYQEAMEAQNKAARLAPDVLRYRQLIIKHRDNLESLGGRQQGGHS